jgi:PAS domain-containing protein
MTLLADRPADPASTSRPAGLGALEDALEVLLSPLAYPDWQTWQVAVHGRLLALSGADALCVYTPLGAAGAWYAPHLTEADLAAYGARAAADPAWDVIERSFAVSGREVAHEDQLLGPGALEASAFFREFLRPHGILDITVAGAAFGGEEPARLHFSNRERRPAERTAEAMALVRAVLPAFRAGLGLWRQLGERRAELARVLDALPDAVLLYETSGTLVHANPSAARDLADAADAGRLRTEAQRLAWSLGAVARREAPRGAATCAATCAARPRRRLPPRAPCAWARAPRRARSRCARRSPPRGCSAATRACWSRWSPRPPARSPTPSCATASTSRRASSRRRGWWPRDSATRPWPSAWA